MKTIFQPKDLRPFRRQMLLIFTPFFLLFLYQADDWEGRMLFIFFAAIFLLIVNKLLDRAAQDGRPIILDSQGLHHENLLERYGSATIPWPEIVGIELVHGSERAEWLGLTLRDPQPTEGAANRTPVAHSGEVRELMAEDLREFRPAAEALPPDVYAGLLAMNREARQRGRPKAAVTKERITIRLSQEVVQSFRATGDGWQTRVDAALKDWLKTHSPA